MHSVSVAGDPPATSPHPDGLLPSEADRRTVSCRHVSQRLVVPGLAVLPRKRKGGRTISHVTRVLAACLCRLRDHGFTATVPQADTMVRPAVGPLRGVTLRMLDEHTPQLADDDAIVAAVIERPPAFAAMAKREKA